jgi:hypothetical protein
MPACACGCSAFCITSTAPPPPRPPSPCCSQSGRFDRLKEIAVEFAFLLKVQGMQETPLVPSGPAEPRAAA